MEKVSKDAKRPKISVAIATYNGEKYIKQQLESIFENLTNDDEIIISDDGSTDNTLKIIESFKDKRIKLVNGPKEGVIKNFENAISFCTGDYIFLSDQDDVWKKNKVDTVLNEFKNDYICVVHDAKIVDGTLENTLYDSYFKHRKTKPGKINNIIKPSYLGCCMAFSKKIVKYLLPFPKCIEMHDRWIGSVCDTYGKVFFLDEQLILYRRHESNVSRMKRNSILTIVKNRVKLINELKKLKKKIKSN